MLDLGGSFAQYYDFTAGALDLLLRRFGKLVCVHGNCGCNLAIAEDLEQALLLREAESRKLFKCHWLVGQPARG